MKARKILEDLVKAWMLYDLLDYNDPKDVNEPKDGKFLTKIAVDTFLYLGDYKKICDKVYSTSKTNADRIRAMSDEALAKELLGHRCDACENDGYCDIREQCEKEILEWLRQKSN